MEAFLANPINLCIVCPLVFLAGFVDAVAGGGGLISLPAYMIVGLPPHVARGTNKVANMFGTAATTINYARKGFIPWREGLVCVVFALIGSFAGTKLGLLVDEDVFLIIMLVIIPITAIYLWFFKPKGLENAKADAYGWFKTTAIASAIALLLGVYDGFYGPGTGTFLIILLTSVARMDVRRSNGISKAINLATNVASAVVFLLEGKVLIPLALICAGCSILGNVIGSRLFVKKDVKIIKPMMVCVLLIFFVKVLGTIIGWWS